MMPARNITIGSPER